MLATARDFHLATRRELRREIVELLDSLSAQELTAALALLATPAESNEGAWEKWFKFCRESVGAPKANSKALLDELYDRTR